MKTLLLTMMLLLVGCTPALTTRPDYCTVEHFCSKAATIKVPNTAPQVPNAP